MVRTLRMATQKSNGIEFDGIYTFYTLKNVNVKAWGVEAAE